MLGEEGMANDFRLLLKTVAVECAARYEVVRVAAERMPHHRQVEATLGLALPDMGQFVDQKALQLDL